MTKNYSNLFSSLLLWAFVLFGQQVSAQVSSYAFNQGSGTFTQVTGGTVFGTTASDDQKFVDAAVPAGGTGNTGVGIPIGFNFTYNGIVFDRLGINNNGWISLGQSSLTPSVDVNSTSAYTPLQSTAVNTPTLLRNRIAGFGRDMQAQASAELRVETIGTAPNRICVVQWMGYKRFGTTGTGDNISWQIRLYETSNYVQVMYGSCTFGTTSSTGTHVGLGGTVATDFNNRTSTTTWMATTAGAANTAGITVATAVTAPTSGTYFIWGVAPTAPGTPVQAGGTPTCLGGTQLTATGSPSSPDEVWYWQTTATGTSTANPGATPWTVFANGTYYIRSYNATLNAWSTAASVAVSNFPTATVPPAPVAGANPACLTTSLTEATPPGGTEYYWQTIANGTSNTSNAATPLTVSTTGTYYVAAYETATGCWSTTNSLAVTINTYVPNAPTTAVDNYNICSGTVSQMIDATPPPGGSSGALTSSFGTNLQSFGSPAATFNVTVPAIPNGATLTSAQVLLTNVNSINGSFRSEIRVALSGAYTLGATQISTLTSGGLISPDPTINLPGFPAAGGLITLSLTETFDDGGAGTVDATFGNVQIIVNYTLPPVSTIVWYDAATAGTQIGSSTPFETVGTTVMPNTTSNGTYVFYAASASSACQSTTRLPITVNVTQVLAQLNPINVTCNGGNNGSFSLGTIQCGTPPFLYSTDNGVTFGPIPTTLTAGSHDIIMQDATLGTSAPITVVITEPAAPTALNATNITYYNATLGWTTTGDEATWTVIYGPTGFDPATSGTVVPGVSNPHTLTGVLTESTSYDFYVFSDCGPVADTSGPLTFMTDSGFLAWDNQCGPGFTDISTTGTQVTGMTDDSESGLTLPWPWNVNGTIVNTITIGNNGGILFNTLTGNIAYTATGNGMFPYVQDLNTALAGGGIYWQSNGVAPNRQFIIQWSNMPHFSTGTDGATFQILVDEATSDVYYFYNDVMMSNAAWNNGADAEIALITPNGTATVSTNSATYLSSNSCIHFYNALCPNVTLTSSLVYADEVIVDWNPGLYGETDWTVVYGLSGFDPAIPAEVIGSFPYNTSSADITGLTQNTSYDMYIYSECAADNITSDGFLYSFTTLPYCANPTTFAVGTDVDSLELTWNWSEYTLTGPGPGTYAVDQFNIMYEMNGVYSNEVIANGLNNADTVADVNLIGSGVYQVYLQAECASGDTSSWVGPITVVMPLSNDTVCGAENLEMDLVYTLNNVGATVSTDEINIAPPTTGAQETDGWANSTLNNTVWYSFVAPASGSVRINNTAINYNGQLAVYDVANCNDFNANFIMLGANDNEIGGTSLAPNFTVCGLTPGDTYYIMHDGSGTTGNYSISISEIVLEAGNAGGLTQICYGETVNLNTTISGNDAGGVWSSPVPTVNAGIIDSIFYSEGLSYQTFNFQYRMSDGCAYDSIVTQVQIFAPSSAGTDGTVTICKNGEVNLYTGLGGFVDMNGQWYDPSDNPTSSDITGSAFAGSFNYDYIAGNGVCPDDTANVVVIVLSTCDELSVEDAAFENVQLYPNPTSGMINIDADKAYNVEITDANGRIIKKGLSTSAGTTSIDLGKVQIGVYFVTLENQGSSKVFRVVVQ